MKKLTKYDKIKLVRDYGLNTEENILVTPVTKPKKYLTFLANLSACSIRTFKDDNIKTPHYAHIEKLKALDLIPELQREKYNIILATPINPKDCAFAGCIWHGLETTIVEVADGPGTVRRVTHENAISRRYTLNNFTQENTNDPRINIALRKIRNIGFSHIIYEFSWYNKKVGHLNENFICWEMTDDGTGKSIVK